MKVSTNWLKDYVDLGSSLDRVANDLTMAGLEVKKLEPVSALGDLLFEIEITTNRPDWLSHIGVAREFAAIRNKKLKLPLIFDEPKKTITSEWSIEIADRVGCPYYSGVYIEGVVNHPVPEFIKDRLMACGVRSINLLVDITNYVLLETGQPLHVFDADKLSGEKIFVRSARQGESMVAIDGSTLQLKPQDLVIADSKVPVALAGVMGGKGSEVGPNTNNIFLEAAFFSPATVRKSAKRHAISTDSSYRFERRVDPEGVDFARRRALYLIEKYAKPNKVTQTVICGKKPSIKQGKILLSLSEIESVLGLKIPMATVIRSLKNLGLSVKKQSSQKVQVLAPSFRSDLTRSIDLIEEVARVYGYDRIPEMLPTRAPIQVSENPKWRLQKKVRSILSGMGLNEAVTFSLVSEQGLDPEVDLKDAVCILNPQNRELTWLRPILATSHLNVIQHNVHHGAKGIGIYEIANVYHQKSTSLRASEETALGLALHGTWKSRSWLDAEREATFYDLKGVLENMFQALGITRYAFKPGQKSFLDPVRSERIFLHDQEAGYIGNVSHALLNQWKLDGDVCCAEIYLDKILSCIRWNRPAVPLPRFPALELDLSVVVSEKIKSGDIEYEVLKLGQGLIQRIQLFDHFRGGRIPKGFKNLGFRLTYQSPEKTLVTAEIQSLHSQIAGTLSEKFKASFQ